MKNLVPYHSPVLHKKAEPLKKVDAAIVKLINEMEEVMNKAGGVGIAAPQVGESIQVAIVSLPENAGGKERLVLLNPKILSAYGSDVCEEGCLSIPGVQVKVKRYKELEVQTLTLKGENVTYKCTGYMARAVQHEIDHLNGILIIDKVSPVRRLLLKKRFKKLKEIEL